MNYVNLFQFSFLDYNMEKYTENKLKIAMDLQIQNVKLDMLMTIDFL